MESLVAKMQGIFYFIAASNVALLVTAATSDSTIRSEMTIPSLLSTLSLLASIFCICLNILYLEHNKFIPSCHTSDKVQQVLLSVYMLNIPLYGGALGIMITTQLLDNFFSKTLVLISFLTIFSLTMLVIKKIIDSLYAEGRLEE